MTRSMLIFGSLILSLSFMACGEDVHQPEEVTQEESESWERAYEEQNSGKADGAISCSGVIVPDRGRFGGRVALTFDDGPSPATTPLILDILKAEGIQATFFINGRRVRSDTERAILARIIEEGHILANHSQAHKDFKTLSSEEADKQIGETHEIIKEAGVEPGFFRFPFGSSNCATAKQVRDYGYSVTGWHIDSADWCFASSNGGVGHCSKRTFKWVSDEYRDDMIAYTMSQVWTHNGGILLFHDTYQNTVNNLQPLIDELRANEYTFTNIDDKSTFPRLNGVQLPFVGDLCSQDDECLFHEDDTLATCLTTSVEVTGEETEDDQIEDDQIEDDQTEFFGFCTLNCDGYCPDADGKAPTFCTSVDEGLTGTCLSKASLLNQECATLPGTVSKEVDRFIGSSSASASTATVCFPQK